MIGESDLAARGSQKWLAAWLFAGLLFATTEALSTEASPQFEAIRVGMGDLYKVGHWTPVELTVRGGQESITGFVSVTTVDGDGTRATVRSDRPFQIVPGRTTNVLVYAKPGRPDGEFDVRLHRTADDGGDEAARRVFMTAIEPDGEHPRQALLATQELIVGIGPTIGIETALVNRNLNQQPDYEARLAAIPDAAALPTRWYGLDGVNYLVFSTSQPELYSALTANSAQLAALRQWLRLGGRLVLSVGDHGDELLAAGGPLADFVPGKFGGMKPARPARAFETFITASEPLPELRRPGASDGRLQVPQLTEVRGRVEIQEGADTPLVVRAPYGFGEVLFVGVDLDQPPFARWSQQGRLVNRLLGFNENQPPAQQSQNMLGFNDLSGQLRAALDAFTGVKIAPFWLVSLLIVLYLVLIGPVDYWLVKHVFKRMEFTWFTFPTMVFLVSGGAYFLATWMKGDALLVNQVDVVDVDLAGTVPEHSLVRGTSWMNVFSPQMRSYDVTVEPKLPVSAEAEFERLVSWMGMPGVGFGGMNQLAADPPLFARSYDYAPHLAGLLGVPIQVWSTKSFTARWNTPGAPGAMIEAELVASGRDAIDGRIVNRLEVPLNDCLLAFGNAAYRVGELKPGAEFRVEQVSRRRLSDELSERRGNPAVAAVNAPVATWNFGSRDVLAIVEQMMFFQATDAWAGTRLDNRYLHTIDLSNHLAMGQAILIGRSGQPASLLSLDDQTLHNDKNRQWTVYRFLLPVTLRQK